MDFEDQIRQHNKAQNNNVLASFDGGNDTLVKAILADANQLDTDDSAGRLEKGRPVPIGTMARRPNGMFIKTAEGWKYHSSHAAHDAHQSTASAGSRTADQEQAVRATAGPGGVTQQPKPPGTDMSHQEGWRAHRLPNTASAGARGSGLNTAALPTPDTVETKFQALKDDEENLKAKLPGYRNRLGQSSIYFHKNDNNGESSISIETMRLGDGKVQYGVYCDTKKVISSRSLADPRAAYQTTSARIIKHKRTKTSKFVDTLAQVHMYIENHLRKVA